MLRLLSVLLLAALAVPAAATAQEPATQVRAPGPAFPPAEPATLADGLRWSTAAPADPLPADAEDPFYLPPADLPAGPGQLIRTQPVPHALNIAGPDLPGHAYRILYTSTTMHGEPVAVSGLVIEPARQWAGAGATPTIVFAPGTRGAGDSCAPSRQPLMTEATIAGTGETNPNFELGLYYAASMYGMRVVVTDYIGLGTPGVHTYVNHREEGHAVLDAARAVVPDGDPVGFFGYSQGGGAVAAAAELAAGYAPELSVRGTYAGAAPADLGVVVDAIDGSSLTGVLGYAMAGFAARDPEFADALGEVLNPAGHEFILDNATSCVGESTRDWGMYATDTLTRSGQRLADAAAGHPVIRRVLAEQKLGSAPPNAPIMLTGGAHDRIIPDEQVRQLGRDHCDGGAQVYYRATPAPAAGSSEAHGTNHALGLVADQPQAMNYLMDRFNEVPAPVKCGSF